MNTDPISTLTVVPATSVTAVPPPAMPETQLPFDPRRLLGGIVSRWRWVALAVVAGTALGIGAGFYRSATRYEVTVRLLKRDVPVGFRAGEFGDAFKPRAINNATLIGTALSDNVLGRVATRAEPAVSLPLLRLSVEAKEQKGTDFVTLTVSGYTSREDTVALARAAATAATAALPEGAAEEPASVAAAVALLFPLPPALAAVAAPSGCFGGGSGLVRIVYPASGSSSGHGDPASLT